MFKYDMGTPHLFEFGIAPGPRRMAVTSKYIGRQNDGTLIYSEAEIKHNEAYNYFIDHQWGWLKSKNNILEDHVLRRMDFWQNRYLNLGHNNKEWIFFCSPDIVSALKNMGIRSQFIDWQVPNTTELEQRLMEMYGDKYNLKEGILYM